MLLDIPQGQRGVRKLTASLANVYLRQRANKHPDIRKVIKKRCKRYNDQFIALEWIGVHFQRPGEWTEDEFDRAVFLRMRGRTDAEIAGMLGRTERAVTRKLGFKAA